ncbi:transcription factor that binds to CRE motif [Parahypoxylon ruwenzoriense]
MATWESQQVPAASAPQVVKFETSPAESLLSAPGDMYPSLFSTTPSTLNPLESVMTPRSFSPSPDDNTSPHEDTPSPAPEPEKKPVKKRKSWGQVLPEPKTNLPPRKRAKTEDEKEQRRVERVLRNRRAAQSSRERKRQEVEALEERNKQLEELLRNQQKTNEILMDELNKLRQSGVSRGSSPLDGFQPSPLTLSQPLFGSSSEDSSVQSKPGMMNDFILMPEQDGTVDPTSLSPELTPVPDDDAPTPSATEQVVTTPAPAATSSDATQHPAAVLCDLQSSNAVDGIFGDDFGLSTSFDIDSWGAQGQFSPSSDPLNFEYNNLADNSTPQFPDFDFDQFLSDDVSGAAPGATAGSDSITQEPDSTFSLFDSENQIPSETLNQQPHLGASTQGCDDGVIAVGV